MLGTLRLSADYLHMAWGGELLAYGNRPGEAVTAAEADSKNFFKQH